MIDVIVLLPYESIKVLLDILKDILLVFATSTHLEHLDREIVVRAARATTGIDSPFSYRAVIPPQADMPPHG